MPFVKDSGYIEKSSGSVFFYIFLVMFHESMMQHIVRVLNSSFGVILLHLMPYIALL